MTQPEIAAFLQVPRTAVLSTLAADGGPHMAAMWFVVEREAIAMWTYAKSQKAVNLRRDPRAAVLVEEGTAYDELKGVLIRGRASLENERAATREVGIKLYERYTLPRTGIPLDVALPEIERQADKRTVVRLSLTDVASWDHTRI